MDSTFDFFAYENQNNQKFENLFDQDFSLSSPFSQHSDSTGIFPNFLPKTIKNLLDVDEGTPSDLMKRENDMYSKKTKPFQIIKQKKEPSPEHSEFTEPAESVSSYNPKEMVENRIGLKSKRILKPEKPKEKIKFKQDAESIMRRVDRKYIPEGFDDPELDDQSKKKMVQMIRNRVSAQSSRDKKKMYLHHLEEMKEELELENDLLIKDKSVLQERIQKLEYEKTVLIQENENLKKNTSYLCSKCGCTLEYEEPSSNKNMEFTDSALASPVGLSRRHSTSKNFFGFSLGFAAVLCFLFMMSGGLGIVPSRHTVLVSVSRYETMPNADVCINTNQISNEPFEEVTNEGEASDQYGLFDVIGSLIDKVRRIPETYFQSSVKGTKQNKFVNPPEIQSFEQKLVEKTEEAKTTPEEDKISSIILQNKSSIHFCPSDFESYKNQANMGINQEKQINFIDAKSEPENLPNRLTVDLERNEFVRVVLHKNSINRLNVPENTYEIANMRIYQAPEIPEEGNPWIEVWCKIFAIRDVATF